MTFQVFNLQLSEKYTPLSSSFKGNLPNRYFAEHSSTDVSAPGYLKVKCDGNANTSSRISSLVCSVK